MSLFPPIDYCGWTRHLDFLLCFWFLQATLEYGGGSLHVLTADLLAGRVETF